MKLIVAVLFAALAISAHAEEEFDWENIDWSKVMPMSEKPGFWDGREIKPVVNPRGMPRGGRIVGGQVVNPHTFPFQAGLLIETPEGNYLCGGSVISATRVLTAAHCATDSSWVYRVILGAHQLDVNEPTQQRFTIPSDNIRVHPNYNETSAENDVAVLILPTAAALTPHVQTISLVDATAGNFAGELATVSGWGRFSDGRGETSQELRSTQIFVVTNAACRDFFQSIITDSVICTSNAGARGPCHGDSGGPLTIGQGVSRFQVGVVSFGNYMCQTGYPAGYSRVSSFNAWITAQ